MVKCSQCGAELSRDGQSPEALICADVFGDEYIESYYLCPTCDVYTVEVFRDCFFGDPKVMVRGPVPKPKGAAAVDLIDTCPDPLRKNCQCKAHRAVFWRGS